MKQFTVGLQAYHLCREAKQQFVGAVAIVLCESGYGNIEVQLVFYHFPNDVHLSLAAIRDDEVGQRGLLVYHASVSPSHHLLHRSVIVGADNGLDVVFPVILS